MIEGKNISKSYGSNLILKEIDVLVKEGEITVLTGPSGAGKTTLFNVLSLLENPDKGLISINNREYLFPLEKEKPIRDHFPHDISVVFQGLHMFPHLTNLENIKIGFGKKGFSLDQQETLDKLVQLFRMEEFIDHYPNQSSKGQQQRVALVRSLMADPKYLFLDEITSALDVEQVGIVLRHLKELRDEGMGIFLITHLIPFAKLAADQIIFMDEGKIVESGGRDTLSNPETKRFQKFVDGLRGVMISGE